jgi:hypothetical protein
MCTSVTEHLRDGDRLRVLDSAGNGEFYRQQRQGDGDHSVCEEDQPLDRRELRLALGLCYVVLDLSSA